MTKKASIIFVVFLLLRMFTFFFVQQCLVSLFQCCMCANIFVLLIEWTWEYTKRKKQKKNKQNKSGKTEEMLVKNDVQKKEKHQVVNVGEIVIYLFLSLFFFVFKKYLKQCLKHFQTQ